MRYGPYDSFGYSSGEGVVASSDAQNVDFGCGLEPAQHIAAHGSNESNGRPVVRQNAPGDQKVSDFGVVWYPFGSKLIKKEKAVPVAISQPKTGAGRTVGFTTGVQAGGNKSGTASRPAQAMPDKTGNLFDQNESAVSRRFVGQL